MLKTQSKLVGDEILFYHYDKFSMTPDLGISCESSAMCFIIFISLQRKLTYDLALHVNRLLCVCAMQTIYMKCLALFSLKTTPNSECRLLQF